MRPRTVALAAGFALSMMAGPASASASTLQLSTSPTTDSSGFAAATIMASGDTGPDPYGLGWELDVFAAPAGAACAASASVEEQSVGVNGLIATAHVAQGTFSEPSEFAPGGAAGGSYVLCGYLSYGSEFGQTDATATTGVTLTPPTPPAGTLSVSVSRRKVIGRATIVVRLSASVNATAAPAQVNVYLDPYSCDASTDFVAYGTAWRSFAITTLGGFTRTARFVSTREFGRNYTRWDVCAYLGQPADLNGGGQLLASAHAGIAYVEPHRKHRHRPSHPRPPTPLQREKARVEAAVAREVAYRLNANPGDQSASCIRLRSGYYKCTFTGFDGLTSEYLGEAHATINPGGIDVVIDYIRCYIGNAPGGGCTYAP